MDEFQLELTKFTQSLPETFEVLLDTSPGDQVRWWVTILMISIGNAYVVSNNQTLALAAKEVLIAKAIDLLFITLTFASSMANALGTECTAVEIFIQFALLWTSKLETDYIFYPQFNLMWTTLKGIFDYQEFDLSETQVSNICEETAGLPEDGLVLDFIPLSTLGLAKHLKTFEDMDLSVDFNNLRRKRISMLLSYLLQIRELKIEQPRNVAETNQSVSISETARRKEFTFEEFESSADESDAQESNEMSSQNPIFQGLDMEVSEEVKALQTRKQSLTKTLSTNVERSTITHETVLIFDTNCLIHSFLKIKKILESRKWKIVFPLAGIFD